MTSTALRRLRATAVGRPDGNVAVEFALALPVLLLLLLGTVELGRYIVLWQKLQRVAISTADLVARADKVTENALDDVFAAAAQLALPYRLEDQGLVILTAVSNPDGTGPEIAWQRKGAGPIARSSEFGTEGGPATLPGTFTVRQGETAILAEVFFAFNPVIAADLIEPKTLYVSGYHRPRLANLDRIEAD